MAMLHIFLCSNSQRSVQRWSSWATTETFWVRQGRCLAWHSVVWWDPIPWRNLIASDSVFTGNLLWMFFKWSFFWPSSYCSRQVLDATHNHNYDHNLYKSISQLPPGPSLFSSKMKIYRGTNQRSDGKFLGNKKLGKPENETYNESE